MQRQPDLRVKYVIEIETIEFFDRKKPYHVKGALKWAREWRRFIDRALREVMCVGPYSKVVSVTMIDPDTGRRIS